MKNLAYILIGFAIGAILTYYFCPRTVDTEEVVITKPKGVITVEEATALSNNWTKYRKKAVDSAAAKQGRSVDDRSVDWSLTDVEDYLNYAKQESKILGFDMTGIRIYLGVYGKNAGQSKQDLTTMFIVPTGKKSLSEANSVNLNIQGDKTIPVGPLNEGGGGQGGYPQ
ncbi:hypothetical protein KFZ70_13860 [Tamlana fucoidanivorans]|uniref:Uncharacterized protein n=1 Tax=Allotamlana fucoidanivorans TaxID=2583814 RepID=A0A5C4SSK1_9FLAO|nr:hypothetical protein [Tamlana fucoidanivorans]TNJ46513.1 hypothetical protein FGF67_02475 [Tamlana fucoidanivorans]